ncbi:MAG: hypothetical protein ACYCYK_03575 [Candidatus Dormibacteria bacterium]
MALVGLGVPLVLLLLLLGLAVLLTLVMMRSSRRHRTQLPSGPGAATGLPEPSGATGPGRLAYEVTIGVAGLIVGGLLILVALWWLLLGVTASALLFSSPSGSSVPNWLPSLVVGLVIGAAGAGVFWLARTRLLRL